MKLLYIIESLRSGGKERRFVSLLEQLTKNYEIEIEVIILSENIHYNNIFDLDLKIHFLKRDFRKDLGIFNKFIKILNKLKPDIVHCWDNIAAFHFGPICKFKRIPFINSMISSAPPINILSTTYFFHFISFPFSDIILSNSQAGLDSYYAPQSKQKVIYNGFNFERTMGIHQRDFIIQKHGINPKWPIIGMIASFTENKDYKTFIKTASLFKNKCTFLAIGDGPNISDMKAFANSLLLDNIFFTGKVRDVESLVNIFDIGVLISNPEFHGEGISNALMECMAFSKPVIATQGGGTNELVIDGITGYLIEPKNSNALAEKIDLLISDSQLAIDMGQAGKKRLIENFSIEKMVDETFKLYKALKN